MWNGVTEFDIEFNEDNDCVILIATWFFLDINWISGSSAVFTVQFALSTSLLSLDLMELKISFLP